MHLSTSNTWSGTLTVRPMRMGAPSGAVVSVSADGGLCNSVEFTVDEAEALLAALPAAIAQARAIRDVEARDRDAA